MKLQDSINTIEKIGNVSSESQFKMKTSRKAFQILSDLYSDKPLAIVRELGCNAADSMVAAGKADQPFHIHLPNSLEPWLTIQDFGTGISHDDIYNIYSVYFESTKTSTNTQVGCLGLGSKSPFCYADNFVITSIHDGTKRIYNAFFNESSTPAIALMSTDKTNESNGVAIQIPVKRDDFYNFQIATQKAFRFFEVKPTISGGNVNWSQDKALFEGDGWASYEKFGYHECYAIMGGVTYPIDPYKIQSDHSEFLRRGGLVLKFDIGELDFTPSREALSYCPQTINAIKNKLEIVVKDFEAKLESTIQDKTNILDAIRTLFNLRSKFEHLSSIKFDKINWRGIDISNPVALIHKISGKGNIVTHSYSKFSKRKFRQSNQINFATDTQWYYDDLAKGTTARIKSYLRSNTGASMCVFPMDIYIALTNHSNPDLCFDKSLFIATSTLPKAYRAVTTTIKGGKSVSTGFKIYSIGSNWLSAWESHEFDPAEPPKYYIVKDVSGWNFTIKPKGMLSFTAKGELRDLVEFLNIDINDVVMVSSRNEKHLKGVAIKLEDYVNSLNLSFDVNDHATASGHYGEKINNIKKNRKFVAFKKDNPNHPFVKFVDVVAKCKENVEKYHHISNKIDFRGKGKAYKLESTNPALQLLVKKIDEYTWEVEDILTLLENLQK